MAFLQDLFRSKSPAAEETKDEKSASVAEGPQSSSEVAPSLPTIDLASATLTLLLDDVLSRVPTWALKPGLLDPAQELHFPLEELSEGISRGKPSISLAKLAERYPDTFQCTGRSEDAPTIPLPLQKLIQQIGHATIRRAEDDTAPVISPGPLTPSDVAAVSAPGEAQAGVGELSQAVELKAKSLSPKEGLTKYEPFGPNLSSRTAGASEPSEPQQTFDRTDADKLTPPPTAASQPRELRKLEGMPRPDAGALQGVVGNLAAPVGGAKLPLKLPLDGRPVPPKSKFVADLASLSPRRTGFGELPKPSRTEAQAPQSPVEGVDVEVGGAPRRSTVPLVESVLIGSIPRRNAQGTEKKRGIEVRPVHLEAIAEAAQADQAPAPQAEVKPAAAAAAVEPSPTAPVERTPQSRQALPSPESATVPAVEPKMDPPSGERVLRIPTGRPTVRPPSIQGPSGEVPSAEALPSPIMPGFVFAPRPGGSRAELPVPLPEPESPRAAPEIQMPRLFSQPPFRGRGMPEEQVEPNEAPEPVATPRVAERATVPSPVPPVPEVQNVEATAANLVEEVTTPIDFPAVDPEDAEKSHGFSASRADRQIAAVAVDEKEPHLMGAHFALARVEQQTLQAIFMTEDFLDLPRVSQLSCNFPGVTGCLLVAGDATAEAGERPPGLEPPSLCRLSRQLAATASALPPELPPVQTFTLHTGNRSLSIFARAHVAVCIVHSHRGFLPGVRERLSAVADTLARGLGDELEDDD